MTMKKTVSWMGIILLPQSIFLDADSESLQQFPDREHVPGLTTVSCKKVPLPPVDANFPSLTFDFAIFLSARFAYALLAGLLLGPDAGKYLNVDLCS